MNRGKRGSDGASGAFPLFFENHRGSVDVWRRCLDFRPVGGRSVFLRDCGYLLAIAFVLWSVVPVVGYVLSQQHEFPDDWVGGAQQWVLALLALPATAVLVRRIRGLGLDWTAAVLVLLVGAAYAAHRFIPEADINGFFVLAGVLALVAAKGGSAESPTRDEGISWWRYQEKRNAVWDARSAKSREAKPTLD